MVIRLFCPSLLVQRTEVSQGHCSEDFEFGVCLCDRVLWTGLSRSGVGGISFELPGVYRIQVHNASFHPTGMQRTVPNRNVDINASHHTAELPLEEDSRMFNEDV